MRRFSCPTCGSEVHFRNQSCVSCSTPLAYAPLDQTMWAAGPGAQLCANAAIAGCNWIAKTAEEGSLCLACGYNNRIPNLAIAGNAERWAGVEQAKRMLFYALIRWNLPRPTRHENEKFGLAFNFLADKILPDGKIKRVMTGHHNGLVTISVTEGDDVIRATRQTAMEEDYRTLIGHMRHEIAHFYWSHLVEIGPELGRFREIFGDERQDYGEALKRHYGEGAPADWRHSYISSYATAHPWEDFAETWAHWMHIVDGVETAEAYGLTLHETPMHYPDPYTATDVGPVIDAWVPMTVALNNMNRGMGQPDLYPFVLSKPVLAKLQFINDLIHAARPA